MILLVFGLSLTLSAFLTRIAGVPQPFIHDEWCYLLQADTFRQGRLTNPTPAGWEQFETFHVLMVPTYQAKYPPGQGMALALGWVLTGLPIVGAWIAVAAACAATAWMLYRMLPPVWALAGSLLTVIHPVVLQWGQSYWGGAVAMLGGALLLGACAGIVRFLSTPRQKPRMTDGAILALALVILFNSRPFEGFLVLGSCVACLLLWNWWKNRNSHPAVGRLIAAFAAVFVAGVLWSGYYNYRVTGNALRLPYAEYESQYEITTPFLWLKPHDPPQYRWRQLREWFVDYQLAIYQRQQSVSGLMSELWTEKLPALAQFFPTKWTLHWLREMEITSPALVVPFWIIAWSVVLLIPAWVVEARSGCSWTRFMVIACAVGVIALCGEILIWPHYAGAFLPCVMVLLSRGLRRLWLAVPGTFPRWIGQVSAVAIVMLSVGAAALWATSPARYWQDGWQYRKAEITAKLESGGKHLVFVRYLPGHDVHHDWVYNGADTQNEPILWVRDGGRSTNISLIQQYPDRQTWELVEDGKSCQITPYRLE